MASDSRSIPYRDHYDRLTTWTANLFEHNPDKCREFAGVLKERTALLLASREQDETSPLLSVLAEIGLASVLDTINDRREVKDDTNA